VLLQLKVSQGFCEQNQEEIKGGEERKDGTSPTMKGKGTHGYKICEGSLVTLSCGL